MIVDCGECLVRGDACRDCVVTVLLGEPGMPERGLDSIGPDDLRINLEQEERDAMAVLADSGLVPRLRLVTSALPTPPAQPGQPRSDGGAHAAG
jgi:hypothetical protein